LHFSFDITQVPEIGTVRLWQDVVGHYRGALLASTTTPSDEDFNLPMVADSLEGAFSGVQSYLSRAFPAQSVSVSVGACAAAAAAGACAAAAGGGSGGDDAFNSKLTRIIALSITPPPYSQVSETR
jgi:hypothetical protein